MSKDIPRARKGAKVYVSPKTLGRIRTIPKGSRIAAMAKMVDKELNRLKEERL